MVNNIKLQGGKQLNDQLNKLAQSLGSKEVQDSLVKGAKPLIEQAKANVASHKDSGDLENSIGPIIGRGENVGTVTVGPRRGKGKNAKGWHAHLLEYGTAPHLIKAVNKKALKLAEGFAASVSHPGTPASPFMRPAWDAKHSEVEKEIAKSLKDALKEDFK